MRHAVIHSGVVTNVIGWDGQSEWTPPDGSTLQALDEQSAVGPGWTFDGEVFAPPVVQPVAQRIFSPRQFLKLLTNEEQDAVQDSPHPYAKVARRNLYTAEYVDLDDPDTTFLVQGLAAAELIAPERVPQILAGESP